MSDPLNDLIVNASAEEQKAQRLRSSLAWGMMQNPDERAKAQRVASQLGTTPQAAQDNLSNFERAAKRNAFDFDGFIKHTPALATWAENPENAAVSHDDLSNLAKFERAAKDVGSQILQIPQRAMGSVFRSVGGVFSLEGAIMKEGMKPGAPAWERFLAFNLNPRSDNRQAEMASEVGRDIRSYYEPLFTDQAFVPETTSGRVAGFVGGLAGTMGKAILSGPAAPVVFGAEALGESGGTALERGATPGQATVKALGSGTLNTALAFIPGGKFGSEQALGQAIAQGGKAAIAKELAKGITARGIRGAALGTGVTVTENLLSRIYDQNTPLFEGIGENIASFIGLEGAGYLSHAVKLTAESKLKPRSPEIFRSALEATTRNQGLDQFTVPVERMTTFFQETGLNPADFGEATAKSYAQALASGTEVTLRTADFLASKATPEQMDSLVPDARFHLSGPTVNEIQAYAEEADRIKADLKAQDEPIEAGPQKAIYEETRAQLLDAGNSDRVADILADRHSRVMVNLAKDFGQDPLAMNERFGLRIYRPAPGEGQSAVDISLGRMGGADPLAMGPEFWQGPVSDAARQKAADRIDALRPEVTREGDAALANPEPVLKAYNEDPRSFGGKVINADLMAEHASKTVADNPVEGHALLGEHGAANRLAYDAYEARLKEPVKAGDEAVLILVGNAAVGKSTLARLNADAYHTILDTHSADPVGLRDSINLALKSGRKVDVILVHAKLEEAIRRNVQRQATEGRPVSIADQADLAVKAPASFASAAETFGTDPDVSFSVADTTSKIRAFSGQEAVDFAQGLRDENASRSTLDTAVNAYTDLLRGQDVQPTESARIALERGIEDQASSRLAQEQNMGADRGGDGSGGGRGPQDANPSGQPEGLDTLFQPEKRPGWAHRYTGKRYASADEKMSARMSKLSRRSGASIDKAKAAWVLEEQAAAKAREDEFLAWEAGVKEVQAGDIMSDNRGFIQFSPDRKVSIALLEKADLSTFTHEVGHMYLEVMGDLATAEGAAGPGVESYQKVLNFLGVSDRSELTRDHHEKFARAMEAYAMEGKAPTPELKGAFQRVKFWMMQVYRSLSDLGVKLNPEIRGVFDRMFAGEEAVNQARNVVDLQPIFATPEAMGTTPAEFEAYSKAAAKAIGTAREAVESRLMRELKREKESWWKAESAKVAEEVTAEVDADPVHQAFKALSEGKLEDGTPIKLNKDALEAQFGAGVGKELPRGWLRLYTREGGMDAEAAAEILGFSSGDQLIEGLKGMEPRKQAIKRITEERMKAQHGDMMTDGSLAEAAVEALHNSAREDMLMAELRILRKKAKEMGPALELKALKAETAQQAKDREALSKAQGQMDRLDRRQARAATEVPPIQAFREAARELVDQTTIRDLQPYTYLVASRKAAREAFTAMSKDDYQAAGDAKQKELLNHHLYLEATKAREEASSIAEYGRKGETAKFQARVGKAGGDYLAQWNALASRYEFRKVSNQELDARAQSLESWVAQQQAVGEGIVIDPALFREDQVKNWREVPISELRAVHDALKNIETVARRQRKVLDADRLMDIEEAVANLSAQAYGNFKTKPLPLDPETRSRVDKAISLAKRWNVDLLKFEEVVDRLDKGDINGPFRRHLFEPMALAQFKETELHHQVTELLLEGIEAMPKEQRMKLADRVTIPGLGGTVSKRFILTMAMNTGNDSNQAKMLKGMGWASPEGTEAVGKALDTLTREDWTFVQKTWDALESLWPEIVALEKRMTGLEPTKIERTPFTVRLADGTTMEMQGGYFPIVFDKMKSTMGGMQADADIMSPEGLFKGAVTFKGHTKERVEQAAAPLVMDFEQVLARHVPRVIKDISHREPAMSVAKLMLNSEVRKAVQETIGPEYEAMMLPWLQGTVNDAPVTNTELSGFINKSRSNLVVGSLAFRASSVLVQAIDPVRAMVGEHAIKPHFMAQAVARMSGDLAKGELKTVQEIRELSKTMRDRKENLDRDLRAMMRRTTGKDGYLVTAQRVGMKGLATADSITSTTVWWAAYQQAISEGSTKGDAARVADRVVTTKLQSGAPKDLTKIQRNQDFGSKLLTTYMGDAVSVYGMLSRSVHNVANGEKIASSAFAFLMAGMVLPVLGDLIKFKAPQDDKDKAAWAAKKMGFGVFSSIPLVRDVAGALESGRDYSFTPLAQHIGKTVRLANKLISDKDHDSTGIALDALDVVGGFSGLPGTGQAMTSANYLKDVKKGKKPAPKNSYELMKNVLFGPPPKGK